ncbi:peptidylprolyl isomerase [Engelhardtia mirabilis]|uniref:peptidylprolyl isomerase n=1 Tax=Engelhardtia mirabilis TaxID=2528011 RepID=UPI0011A2F36E
MSPAQTRPARAVEASVAQDLRGGAIPARAGDLELTWEEFDQALLNREGTGEVAEVALVDLGERALLRNLADAKGVQVTDDDLAASFAELDGQLREAGVEGGLAAELERAGVPLDDFKDRLRLQIVLERLVRKDLAIPADRPCPADQQQLWLDAKLGEAKLERLPRPWADGVVARMGERAITGTELAAALRQQLPSEELRELCFQVLLAKAVEARLPDLSAEGRAAAIEAEVGRRRAEAEADPRYQGVAFERLLEARGMTLDSMRQDPAVRVAALSTHFVDTSEGDAGLRRTYEAERDWFEDRFGRSVSTRILYLIAAPERGPLTPRNYSDATAVLVDLATQVTDEDAFDRLARLHSEDALSRERGGWLGFVARASEGVPAALREEIFNQVDAGQSGLVGPVRLDNGMALLWLGAVRPSPPWERMRENVHRELRRRFLVETLPPETVVTYLDPGR